MAIDKNFYNIYIILDKIIINLGNLMNNQIKVLSTYTRKNICINTTILINETSVIDTDNILASMGD